MVLNEKKVDRMIDYYSHCIVCNINQRSNFKLSKEDIKQDLWVKVLEIQKRNTFNKKKNIMFETYINSILKNEVKLILKSKTSRNFVSLNHYQDYNDQGFEIDNKILFKIEKEKISESLNGIEKQIFDMLGDFSKKEISEKLGFNTQQSITNIVSRNIRKKSENLLEFC